MIAVYSQGERPLAENQFVAVAIGEPRPNQRHTGIFFRCSVSDAHEFLHLATHNRLLRQPPPTPDYFWIQPLIPQRRLLQVAAICEQIATANVTSGIPYSFGPPNECFDARDCRFLLGPTKTGLTCASFVLAVFHRAGIQLVRYGSWPPPTAEDIEWQQQVVSDLTAARLQNPDRVTQDHINSIMNEVGSSARYRPEHVGGAALKRRYRPVRYRVAYRAGELILCRIRGLPTESTMRWWERLRQRFFH
jgi:hypothetical protein